MIEARYQQLYEALYTVADQMADALRPFAAKVHVDGVEAPYPEEEWIPLLDAAKAALKRYEDSL